MSQQFTWCPNNIVFGYLARKTETTLRKILHKLQPYARKSFSSLEKDERWNPQDYNRIALVHCVPPSYGLVRILDGYKWSLQEPIATLMLCDNVWESTYFSCKITGVDCKAIQECIDDLITIPCGHAFHPDCIHQQLRRHMYARCPVCQHTLHYRLCHHRVHVPFHRPGTVMDQNELDGACQSCAPFAFMQQQLEYCGPTRILPRSDKYSFGKDFGWHWWILSIFEGGTDRYLAERSALLRRLFRVCAGQDEHEREFAMVIFDTLRLLYVHLKEHEGLDWVHALCLVGPVAYEEASLCNGKTPEQRGVDIWRCLMDMMVERLRLFHLRGAKLWQPQELLPFQPYYPMVEELTNDAI